METLVTDSIDEAAAVIRRGGLVAFPTETVYGLGADVFNESAIARIFEAKMRPADNPLIAHVADKGQIATLGRDFTLAAGKLMGNFFPGPLTVVVRRSEKVPDAATAGLETIGIRMPRFEIAQKFIAACGVPIVAPSANLSGRPSPTTWQAVYEDLNGRIDCILRGEPTEIGLESTVVDCTTEVPVLLRLGSVSLERLQHVVPSARASVPGDLAEPRSPGMRHKHYAPKAKIELVDSPSDAGEANDRTAFIGLHATGREFRLERVCQTVDEYAHELFEFFRECDRASVDTIYCQRVPEAWMGATLMDRLRRAAEN